MNKIKTTAFLGVFEQKLEMQKHTLQKELSLAKSERRVSWMRAQIKNCKRLRELIKEMKKEASVRCPHCGEIL